MQSQFTKKKYTQEMIKTITQIQKLWRSYVDKKIYQFYKQIINFKLKGNPSQLLKAINPCEAQLLDASINSVIRFRLGGEKFPPNIYYKIFSVKGVCDLNSYAPRDYSNIQTKNKMLEQKKMTYEQYKHNKMSIEDEGWYLRVDNNGWRPISEKYVGKPDFIQIFSANKVKYYHHKKEKRQEKCFKKIRLNKIKWMQQLYKDKKEEEMNQQKQFVTEQLGEINNPFDDPKLVNLNDENFDDEVNKLIEWSQQLDYDSYLTNWHQVATSNLTNVISPDNKVNKFLNSKFQSIYEEDQDQLVSISHLNKQ